MRRPHRRPPLVVDCLAQRLHRPLRRRVEGYSVRHSRRLPRRRAEDCSARRPRRRAPVEVCLGPRRQRRALPVDCSAPRLRLYRERRVVAYSAPRLRRRRAVDCLARLPRLRAPPVDFLGQRRQLRPPVASSARRRLRELPRPILSVLRPHRPHSFLHRVEDCSARRLLLPAPAR